MSWADNAIKELKNNKETIIYPKGNSMLPYIKSGQPVKISSDITELNKRDIVLVKFSEHKVYLHFISAIKGKQYQISNAKGYVNGWVTKDKIIAKAVPYQSPDYIT